MSRLFAGSVAVILPAAGSSRRFGGCESKLFARLAGQPVWWHSANRLRQQPQVGPIVMAINPADRARWEAEFSEQLGSLDIQLVDGGRERCDSVLAAMENVGESPFVAVHDAARPLVSDELLQRLFGAAAEHPAVILAVPVQGTVKRTDPNRTVQATVNRENLWEAQTPQLFSRQCLIDAYQRWRGWPITDDASLVERSGQAVHVVLGSPTNLKITTVDDLAIAEAILNTRH